MDEQEDNVYQSSTQFMTPPKAQVDEADKEKDETVGNAPQIIQTIRNLNASIEIYNTNDGVDESVLLNPEEFMHAVAANKIVVEILRKEVKKLEAPIKEYVTQED